MAESELVGVDNPQGSGVIRKCAFCCSELQQKHEPYLLPCLHSSCKTCLPLSQPTVQCGDCEFPFAPSEAINHLLLLERLEAEAPEEDESTEEETHHCTSCDENMPANGYCKDCEEWLCRACISAHQRVKVTKDHVMLTTEEAGAALKAAAKQRYQYCTRHPKEQLKCFCTKCDVLTCRDCQRETHQTHDFLLLNAAWEQQRPQLKILQERIAEKQAFLREYIHTIEKCQDANAQAESRVAAEIKQFAVRAITLINSRAKQLVRDLQANCDQKRDQLQHKRQGFLALCKKLLDCHGIVDELLTSGSELSLVFSKGLMERHMTQLIERTVSLPNFKADVQMKFCFDHKVLDALQMSGSIQDTSTIRGPQTGIRTNNMFNGMRPAPVGVGSLVVPGMPEAVKHQMINQNLERARLQQQPTPPRATPPPKNDSGTLAPAQHESSGTKPSSNSGSNRPTPTPSPAVEASKESGEDPSSNQRGDTASNEEGGQSQEPSHPHQEDNSDDWCAVCHDGGELLCCGSCPKVYHLHCHVPNLVSTPGEDWKCTLCTAVIEDPPCLASSKDGGSKRKIPVGLSGKQLKVCEKILLQLFCHNSSTPFQTPVSRTVPNYFKIITRPMDLSTVKQKLSTAHFNHYDSAQSFIGDIKLIFKNCYTFNAKESQLSRQAKVLEEFFVQMVEKELSDCVADMNEEVADAEEVKRSKTA